MKVVKKILIIILIIAIVVGGLSYLDYFLVKNNNALPKIAVKKEYKDKQMVVYNALFYKVWLCKADETTIIGDYGDPNPVCASSYVFKDGYYTNSAGLKIKKRDLLLLIYNNIHTNEMIEIMTTQNEVDNAVYVSEEFGKTAAQSVEKKGKVKGEDKEYSLVVFPTFEENKDKNTYEWTYDKEDESNYYCAKVNEEKQEYEYSKYTDGYCLSTFSPIRLSEKWCKAYTSSTLVYSEELIGNFCKE